MPTYSATNFDELNDIWLNAKDAFGCRTFDIPNASSDNYIAGIKCEKNEIYYYYKTKPYLIKKFIRNLHINGEINEIVFEFDDKRTSINKRTAPLPWSETYHFQFEIPNVDDGYKKARTIEDVGRMWESAREKFGIIKETGRIYIANLDTKNTIMYYTSSTPIPSRLVYFAQDSRYYYVQNDTDQNELKITKPKCDEDTWYFKFIEPQGGASKSYVVYNGHRYVMRTEKNKRFIQTKGGKLSLSTLKSKARPA